MTCLSHQELEHYSDWELENIAVSIQIILDRSAFDRLKLDRKSREEKEKIPYENTMSYYKKISENYEKNLVTRESFSWFYKIISRQPWTTYKDDFEEYITEHISKSKQTRIFEHFCDLSDRYRSL
jgi:hypothetical protein